METVDKAFEVCLPCLVSKITVIKCCVELTFSVKATTLVLSKHIKHLGDTCKGIFEPRWY